MSQIPDRKNPAFPAGLSAELRHAGWPVPARRGPQRLLALLLITVMSGLSASVEARALPRAPAAVRAPAAGMLLVARRDLPSRYFSQSVVLILRQDASGTLGVILNRRTRFRHPDLLPELAGAAETGHPVLIGGPVAPQSMIMLVRNASPEAGVERVTGDIFFSAERAAIEAQIARRHPAGDVRFYVGHAAWAAGQLDAELERGAWHLRPANAEAVFGDSEETLWQQLIDRLDPPGIRVEAPGPATGRGYWGSGWRRLPGLASSMCTSPSARSSKPPSQ